MVSHLLTTICPGGKDIKEKSKTKGNNIMKQLINTIESNIIARYGFESRITRIVFKATEIIKTMTKRD